MKKKSKAKLPDQKVWAVIDRRYGVVGLYQTKKLAMEACDKGINLFSGWVGLVRPMKIRKSVDA